MEFRHAEQGGIVEGAEQPRPHAEQHGEPHLPPVQGGDGREGEHQPEAEQDRDDEPCGERGHAGEQQQRHGHDGLDLFKSEQHPRERCAEGGGKPGDAARDEKARGMARIFAGQFLKDPSETAAHGRAHLDARALAPHGEAA